MPVRIVPFVTPCTHAYCPSSRRALTQLNTVASNELCTDAAKTLGVWAAGTRDAGREDVGHGTRDTGHRDTGHRDTGLGTPGTIYGTRMTKDTGHERRRTRDMRNGRKSCSGTWKYNTGYGTGKRETCENGVPIVNGHGKRGLHGTEHDTLASH